MLAKRVQVVFCFQIRIPRFFRRSKQSQSDRLVVDFDFRQPLVIFLANACKTTLIVPALAILRVLRVSGLPQVTNAVISPVAINVVQLARRPLTVNIQPRQTMRSVEHVVEPDCDIPISHAAASCVARSAPPTSHVPPKNSCVWGVYNKRFKPVLRDVFAVHDLNNISQARICQA